jgi:hypothetical protein
LNAKEAASQGKQRKGTLPRIGGRRIPDEMQYAIDDWGAVMGLIDFLLMAAVKVGSTSARAIRRMALRMWRLGHVEQAG